MTDVETFWQTVNTPEGDACLALFNQIKTDLDNIHSAITAVNALIDEYNNDCADKCLAGFIKCGTVCKTNEECCIDNGLVECGTNNHDYPATPVTDAPDAICFNWCC